jgi:hypothetical protein
LQQLGFEFEVAGGEVQLESREQNWQRNCAAKVKQRNKIKQNKNQRK